MRSFLSSLCALCAALGCNENSLGVSNASPDVLITSHLDGDLVVDMVPFIVRAVGSDADSAPEDLTASWSAAGSPEPSCQQMPLDADGTTSCTVILSMDSDPARVQVEVRDKGGAIGADSVDLVVQLAVQPEQQAPTVVIVRPGDGETSDEGEPVSFEAQVDDAEDAPSDIALSWASDRDGTFSTASADSSGTALFVYGALAAGDHVITLTATDTSGQFSNALVTHHVNALPTAPSVSITPSAPSSAQDLQAVIDSPSEDAEGGAVSYTWEWRRDGVLEPTATSSLLLAPATTRGELWTVRAYPLDDDGGVGPYGEASALIENAPPVIVQATLSPDPAWTDDTLTLSTSALDADGDALVSSYVWRIDGVAISATGETLDGAAFERGQTVDVLVTANDGSADSPVVASNAVLIANSPPTAPSVTLSPALPIEGIDPLYCAASGSIDADGDPFDYVFRWTTDGDPYPSAGDAGPFSVLWPDDSASAADTSTGESWTCAVLATDALSVSGPEGSVSVVIGETVFIPDYNGTFDIVPDLSYRCAFGLVDLDISQLTLSVAGSTLSVSGGPVVMTGIVPADENFSAQGVIAGGCTETYTISGSFLDEDHFVGTMTLSFNGAQCGLTNCNNQSWPVDGYRL